MTQVVDSGFSCGGDDNRVNQTTTETCRNTPKHVNQNMNIVMHNCPTVKSILLEGTREEGCKLRLLNSVRR